MSELERRGPGRPCSVCGHAERHAVELAIVDGSSFRAIADAFPPLSRNAIRRHALAHLPSDLAAGAEAVTGLTATTLLERLHDIARSAREAREEAMQAGHHVAAVKAGDGELRALTVIASMGVRHEAEIESASAQRLTLTALRRAIRAHPELGEPVAAEYDALGLSVVADAVRDFVSRTADQRELP